MSKKKPQKQPQRKKISPKLSEKVKARIRENAKQGFPKTTVELAKEFENVTPTTIQNFKVRMKDLPKSGSHHKAKWKQAPGGPQKYEEIDDFIISHTALSDAELARLCNMKLNALEKRKAVLRAQGKIGVSAKFAGGKGGLTALENRIMEEIESGALKDGLSAFYERIGRECDDEIKKSEISWSKKWFADKVEELLWNRERLELLSDVMLADLSLDVFQEPYPYIPRAMVETRAKKITGLITRHAESSSSLRGIGRLDLGEIEPKKLLSYRLPKATFKKPIKIAAGDVATVMTLIPNIGVLYDRDINVNVPRLALSYARHRGVKAVIVSSLFDIDVTKAAGPNKVYRALVSGLRTKPENLASSYQDEAKRILDEQKMSPQEVELVYTMFAERFDTVLEACDKIFNRPKDESSSEPEKEPQYDGPVLIVFGIKEEATIASVAYAEARIATIKKQFQIRTELRAAEKTLQRMTAQTPSEKTTKQQKRVHRLVDAVNRTVITNVPDDLYRLLHRRTRALVIKKIEETIPNSKVISIGSCTVQIGEKEAGKIALNIPDHTKISFNLLGNYVGTHGPKTLRKEMAPTTVILHPHALFFDEATRERDADGVRGSPARVYVSPIALDDEFIRGRLDQIARKMHPISKLVFTEQFMPGVLMLDYNNGMINGYPISIAALAKTEQEQKEKKKEKTDTEHVHVPLMHDPVLRFIYLLTVTDPHYGSRNRETDLWCEERQKYFGVDEAFFHLLRRSRLCQTSDFPFHMFSMNDDPVQGNHFQVQQQPHQNEMPQWKIEEKLREFRAKAEQTKNREATLEIFRDIQKFVLRQFALRPPDWFQNQLKMICHYHVDSNMDIFSSIVQKAVQTRIVFKGVSQFSGVDSDERDIGCVNCGSGNHGLKTLNREMTEGWIMADRILLRLLGSPEWNGKEDELRRLVRAPLYSNRFFAWGTVRAPSGYEYAFDLRDSPPKMRGWNDTLAGWIKVDPARGNIQRFAEGKFTIKTCGDKHFHASAIVPYALYMMCAPGTHTDLFAEAAGGLPPNSTGISIVGLPKDGPDSGPFIIRHFPYERLKFHIEHPEIPFDWKAYLPNPL